MINWDIIEMAGAHLRVAALLLSLVLGGLAFPTSEPPELFIAPFRLTYTPAHVVRHVTRDVILRCEDEEDTESRLQEISRIRMLKKAEIGWTLVAQLRDDEDTPTTDLNVTVTGRISQNVRDTFLEVRWDLASEDTFGTYICDVIGFDKDTYASAVELTTEVAVAEENVTAGDLLEMLQNLKKELFKIGDKANNRKSVSSLDDKDKDFDIQTIRKDIDFLLLTVDSLTRNVASIEGDVTLYSNQTYYVSGLVKKLNNQVGSLKKKINDFNGNVKLLNETDRHLAKEISDLKGEVLSFGDEIGALDRTMSKEISTLEDKVGNLTGEMTYLNSQVKDDHKLSLARKTVPFNAFSTEWPGGHFALLRPKVGCPLDMTFAGQNSWFIKVSTTSLAGSGTEVPWTVSPGSSDDLSFLTFCEASGAFNTRAWPYGSYCINQGSLPCPQGFHEGRVDLHMIDGSIIYESNTAITISSSRLAFCCKGLGSFSTPMELPTHSPFLLYRRGYHCQAVQGMSVSHKILSIESVSLGTSNDKEGVYPDIDISPGSPVKIHLCYYEKL